MDKTKSYSPEDETPFNMAMMYYLEIHQLRMAKSRAVINNDMFSYYDCLQEIFISISFKLKLPEKNWMEKNFKAAYTQLCTEVGGSLAVQVRSMALLNAKQKLKEIDMKLVEFMHKYKMIFPNIQTTKGLKELTKKYKL